MIIRSIHVENFRSLESETLECERLTALVGANGSGKSAFLRALELFYETSPRVEADDFYNRDTDRQIVIALTFSDLSDAAAEQFSPYLDGDSLTVERIIDWSDGKVNAEYHGSRLQAVAFALVRQATKAEDKKAAYNKLLEDPLYADLPKWKKTDQALEALKGWEEAHPSQLGRARDEGKFFGFTEVASGYLGMFTRLLVVPAVRDASADAEEGRGTILTDLMDLVVRSVLAAKQEVRQLKEETQNRYLEILDPSRLKELSTLSETLTGTLQTFVPDASVNLSWLPLENVSIPLPRADVRLVEDDFESSVERTGHGLQRAFIVIDHS